VFAEEVDQNYKDHSFVPALNNSAAVQQSVEGIFFYLPQFTPTREKSLRLFPLFLADRNKTTQESKQTL
jgi:hypothetical protein